MIKKGDKKTVKGFRKLSHGRAKFGKVGGNPSPFFGGLKDYPSFSSF